MNRVLFRINPGLLLIMSLAIALGPSARAQEVEDQQYQSGHVTANILNVRARPATHYEVVAKLNRDDEVQIVSVDDEWVEILAPKSAKAYIAARFVDSGGIVSADRVRVHSGPGLVFTSYGYVNEGDKVTLIGQAQDEWQQIEPPATATVWISREFVEMQKPEHEEEILAALDEPATEQTQTAEGEDAAVETEPDTVALIDLDDDVAEDAIEDETMTAGEDAGDSAEETLADSDIEPAPAIELEPLPQIQKDEEEIAAVPATAETEMVEPVVTQQPVLREGIILALPNPVPGVATHVLTKRIHYTVYPICYLRSSRADLDLVEWEYRQVKIRGNDTWYHGWEKPVLNVRSIQIDFRR